MLTVQEAVDNAIAKIQPNCSEKDKKVYEEIAYKVIRGIPPHAAVGITKDMETNLYTFAYRLYGSGKYQQALLVFSLLATVDDMNPRYLFGSAACYHMLKQYEDAINAYYAAYYRDTNSPLAFYHLSDCYRNIKRIDYAIMCLSMVQEIAGDQPKYAKIKERASLTKESLILNLQQQAIETQKQAMAHEVK